MRAKILRKCSPLKFLRFNPCSEFCKEEEVLNALNALVILAILKIATPNVE